MHQNPISARLHFYRYIAFVFLLCFSAPATATEIANPRREIITGPLNGHVVAILDGDTVAVRVQVWIGQHVDTRVRIAGIDAPEMRGKCMYERKLARDARDRVQALLHDDKVIMKNIRLEKYAGRVLADVYTSTNISVGDHLLSQGLAKTYHGRKKNSWC